MNRRVDEIDARILKLLQHSGRMKRVDIAHRVGLSVPSVSKRMRRLERDGLIRFYGAMVDAKSLDIDITAFIRVSVDTSTRYGNITERLCACEEVLEVHSITGQGSHVCKVRTRNTTTLESLLSRIQGWPGVTGTSTSVVLSTYKETLELPITSGTEQDQSQG